MATQGTFWTTKRVVAIIARLHHIHYHRARTDKGAALGDKQNRQAIKHLMSIVHLIRNSIRPDTLHSSIPVCQLTFLTKIP
jgi:hypothetical protein